MGLLDKLWDDTMGGPQPEKLRKLEIPKSNPGSPRSSLDYGDSPREETPGDESTLNFLERRLSAEFQRGQEEARKVTQSISISKPAVERSTSLPSSFTGSPGSSGFMSSASRREENVWRSVFHPGSNKVGMDRVHAGPSGKWDKVDGKAPSVYDWMYDPKSRSQYR